jgi:cob(I)alamin adenosyltransferase
MKWSALTKASGDDGKSHFCGDRISKAEEIFEIMGEIDMLNAYIGICHSNTVVVNLGNLIQEQMRNIMGYWHTGGKHKKNEIDGCAEQISEHLKSTCKLLDARAPSPVGWYNYNSYWFVACCQCRKIERMIVRAETERVGMTQRRTICCPRRGDYEKMVAIFNRLSKLLYTVGILETL